MNRVRFLFLLLIPGLVQAEAKPTAPGKPLTLVEAVEKGLVYSPDLKKAEAAVRESDALMSYARSSLFPVLNAKASTDTHQNSTTLLSGNVPSGSSANGETYYAALELTQPLYAGGAVTSGLSGAKVTAEMARQSFLSAQQTVIKTVVLAYYDLAKSRQKLESSKANRDLLKSYFDVNQRYERIGRARRIDRLQAGVNYSMALADVQKLESSTAQSEIALSKLIGEESKGPIQTDFKVTIQKLGPMTVEQAYESALANNISVRNAGLNTELVTYTEDVDLAVHRPSLNLTGALGYSAGDRQSIFNDTSRSYKLGVNLVIPLFSGLSSVAKKNMYSEKRVQAEKESQSIKDSLYTTIAKELKALEDNLGYLAISEKAVKEAREALDLANKDYQRSMVSSTDVMSLQRTRYEAEKVFIDSQYDYLESLLKLREAMGVDLEKTYAKQ